MACLALRIASVLVVGAQASITIPRSVKLSLAMVQVALSVAIVSAIDVAEESAWSALPTVIVP